MKLLFKQRMFSWFGSYDIFDEAGNTVYTVKGKFSWGHCLKIFDASGNPVGTVKQRLLSFLPRFEMYLGNICIGCITKEFSLLKPRYNIDCNGWYVEGNFFEWDYNVTAPGGACVARVTKEFFNFTDTYSIDVVNPKDSLCALMLVLAIDAEKSSRE